MLAVEIQQTAKGPCGVKLHIHRMGPTDRSACAFVKSQKNEETLGSWLTRAVAISAPDFPEARQIQIYMPG